MTKTSKADQVRAWLNGSDLDSFEIAEAVGCHPGFVRALKQRMLHPEREKARQSVHSRKYDLAHPKQKLERDRRWRQRRAEAAHG